MDAVLTAMVEDKIGPGEQARLLIQIAKEKLKFEYCLALRSPALALYWALKSLNVEAGQGVILSALSPRYYAQVLADLSLKPLYCDVLPSSAFMGRETVEAALAGRGDLDVRCVLLHHTLGYLPDASAICDLGLPVIEDCSQSYGTFDVSGSGNNSPANQEAKEGEKEEKEEKDRGNPAGSRGVFTILGLEERDMLTSGGGALLYAMNRRDASVLRNLGDLPPEYALPDMNAAMAVVQFREAAKNLEKRREIARVYTRSALRSRHKRFVQRDEAEYNNYAFPLILETGLKDVKAYAKKKDVAVENAFENSLAGRGMVLPGQCPESYSLSLRTVLFPLFPRLSSAEIETVAKLIGTIP